MYFEKRHLHAALEGCDKYLYPRLSTPLDSTQLEWHHDIPNTTRMSNDGSTSINAIDADAEADFDAVGLAFGAGTQPTLQMLAPLIITNNRYHYNIYTHIYIYN